MTLAIDSQETSATGHHLTTSPLTWTFTNTAGTLLVVAASATSGSATAAAISGVTYNSVAMTQFTGSPKNYQSSNQSIVSLWFLKNPATGANTVSVSWTAGVSTPDALGCAISFTGNDTTTPTGTCATNSTSVSNGTSTVNVTGTSATSIIVSASTCGATGGFTAAVAPTVVSSKLNNTGNTGGDNLVLGDQPGSGTQTCSFTLAANDIWGIIASEIFQAAVVNPPLLPLSEPLRARFVAVAY